MLRRGVRRRVQARRVRRDGPVVDDASTRGRLGLKDLKGLAGTEESPDKVDIYDILERRKRDLLQGRRRVAYTCILRKVMILKAPLC